MEKRVLDDSSVNAGKLGHHPRYLLKKGDMFYSPWPSPSVCRDE